MWPVLKQKENISNVPIFGEKTEKHAVNVQGPGRENSEKNWHHIWSFLEKGEKYKTKIGHFNQRKQRKQFIETPLVNLTPPKKYSK